jgi:Zn-dependent protease with chaperone function
MCWICHAKTSLQAAQTPPQGPHRWSSRRGFLLAAGAAAASGFVPLDAQAQVDVGSASGMRRLVPAQQLEQAAARQYRSMMDEARRQNALAPDDHPQVRRLRAMAQDLIPFARPWNERSTQWQWEINLIASNQINAFCMPGGKIAFYTGILDTLKLTDDETAMIMGHEMAHALREHARARLAKSQATSIGLSIGAQLLGLGDLGNVAANLGTELLTLQFSRSDETEADLVGLELAARGAYHPQASVTLWEKMTAQTGGGGPGFLSTHPPGPNRIRELQANVPKVAALYQAALARKQR